MESFASTRDLLAAGYSNAELRQLVRSQQRSRIRRGVYSHTVDHAVDGLAAPFSAIEQHRRLIRATLPVCAPDSVVSHRSAAVLWGLPLESPPDRVEITRMPTNGGQDRGCVHLRIARLDPSELTVVDGLPVTTLARTVVDLARALPLAKSVIPGDAALAAGVGTPELDHSLALAFRRPGVIRARRACAFFDRRSESAGESVSRVILVSGGLPAPELQFEIRSPDGDLIGRSDFFWREQGVIGEFDGRVKYGRLLRPGQDPGDVVFAEKRREDSIRRLGYEVVRWTFGDLFRPGLVVSWVQQAIDLATRRRAS